MIGEMVISLLEIYGRNNKPDNDNFLISIWQKALVKLTESELKIGWQNLLKSRTKSGMPAPAELFQALYADLNDDALMGWNKLFQVLKSHPGRPIHFQDTVLGETVRRLGGLNFLGSLSNTDLQFQRKTFIDTYCVLARQGDEYSPLCEGTYEARPIEIPSLASRKTLAVEGVS